MMKRVFILLALVLSSNVHGLAPDVEEFRPVPQFPQPADGSFGVVGTNLLDGRFILWNGDDVYVQKVARGSDLELVATGFLGDPGFIALNPDGDGVLMGAGFSPVMYLLDLSNLDPENPFEFVEGTQIAAPTQFSGVFLNDSLVLIDRGKDDFSGTELIVFDLSATRGSTRAHTVVTIPADPQVMRQLVIDKPAGSFSSLVNTSPGRSLLYAMDANTRELRSFSVSAIVAAFNGMTTLDWVKDGTPIGTIGQFFSGGVSGTTPDNELVIGGAEGFGLPGGVQFVNPIDPATIVAELDPAGDQPNYVVIYNRAIDELIAIDTTFGVPIVAYATELGIAPIPPENPCEEFEEIMMQFQMLLDDFGVTSDDIDADLIPDEGTLGLVDNISCQASGNPITISTRQAYDANLLALDAEPSAAQLAAYREILAVLMLMSADMQFVVTELLTLAEPSIVLTQSYEIVTCTDLDTCMPEFVEDPNPPTRTHATEVGEAFHADGDTDGDGLTNLEEYNNVLSVGGDITDFIIAALSDRLTGANGLDTGGGGGGGCLIATAAYGTPLEKDIDALRALRDEYLLTNVLGAAFTDTYYRLSSPIADRVAQSPALRSVIRAALVPVVFAAQAGGWSVLVAFVLVVSLLAVHRKRSMTRKRIRGLSQH